MLVSVKGNAGARLLSARLSVVGVGGGARRVHGEVGLCEVGHKCTGAHERGRWARGGAGECGDSGGSRCWRRAPGGPASRGAWVGLMTLFSFFT
jgi:hypothetical protein